MFGLLSDKYKIDFEALKHLDSIGLISFDNVVNYARVGKFNNLTIHYYGNQLQLEFENDGENSLDIGNVILTQAGQQLSKVCDSKPVEGFLEYVIEIWVKEQSIKVWSGYMKVHNQIIPQNAP